MNDTLISNIGFMYVYPSEFTKLRAKSQFYYAKIRLLKNKKILTSCSVGDDFI